MLSTPPEQVRLADEVLITSGTAVRCWRTRRRTGKAFGYLVPGLMGRRS